MLSKFEVRFGALVFWDTFRRGAAGRYWSARGMISFSFQLVTGQRNFVTMPARSVQTPKLRLLMASRLIVKLLVVVYNGPYGKF